MTPWQSPLVAKLVALAIEEDLAFGDVTSELLDSKTLGTANILAREDLIVCGLPITNLIVEKSGFEILVETKFAEGQRAKAGDILQTLKGPTHSLTSIERTVLNFLQRLSGVASYTRSIVDQAAGLTILDTRKTTPGYRLLEKYATSIGGAKNHRMHLGEMILVKNNHIDAADGKTIPEKVKSVLAKIKQNSGHYIPVQVEVRNEEELRAVLDFSPDAVLLDNMDNKQIEHCVALVKAKSDKIATEASGGIDIARLKALAKTGVDAASLGRLTTKATNVDISMKLLS